MSRTRLYLLILLLSGTGYIWLFLNHSAKVFSNTSACFFRNVTGIPCPSCGSTRSVLSILQGKFHESLHLNPLGYLILIALLVLPAWIVSDLVRGKDSFYHFYKMAEKILAKKIIAVPAIIIILLNWIWILHNHV